MFNILFSEEPKDKVSVLNKQKQMTIDAKNLSFEEWNKKWGNMDAEDTKAFFPGQVYEGKGTYKMFQEFDPAVYDKRISTETKRLESARKEDERLNSEAAQKAGFLKAYIQNQSDLERIYKEAPSKFGYDPNEDLDPVAYVKAGMMREAEERIKNKQGIGLTGDPKNEMVCIKGVCTLAANQGVDFSKAFSDPKYKEGVDIDEKGRVIPQFNPFFAEAYEKAGFQKLPKGEKPKPGDFAQYYYEGKPKHMEMVLSDKGDGFETFNNYDLYNTYVTQLLEEDGGAGRTRRFYQGNTPNVGAYEQTDYYRISPETAAAALASNPEYSKKLAGKKAYETSEDKKRYEEATKFLAYNKSVNVLGEDQGLMQDIIKGIRSGVKKEDLIKSLIPKSKNPRLLERTINNL